MIYTFLHHHKVLTSEAVITADYKGQPVATLRGSQPGVHPYRSL